MTSPEASRLPAYVVWLVYSAAWGFVGTLSWTTAAVYFIRDADMSALELILAGTALEVAYFLFEVPTGVVADLYSRRLSIVIACLVSGVAMVLTGAIASAPVILAAMALWGFGWTFRSGTEDAWLADEVGPQRLGHAYQRGAQVERIAGLVGIGAAVGLALLDLGLPFLVSGGTVVVLAVFLAVAMPEAGFVRPTRLEHTRGLASVVTQARAGARVVSTHHVLILIVGIAFVAGAWSEGFDRLKELHLLDNVGLPDIGDLDNLVWFGILQAGGLLLSILVAAPLISRLENLDLARLAKILFALYAVLIVVALVFALAYSLWLAIAAFWFTMVVRQLISAPYLTWLNGTITDSSVRATVLSIVNIGDSCGQWIGGPAIGVVANKWGVRTALVVCTLALSPVLVLFGRAVRHHGREPELAEDVAV